MGAFLIKQLINKTNIPLALVEFDTVDSQLLDTRLVGYMWYIKMKRHQDCQVEIKPYYKWLLI